MAVFSTNQNRQFYVAKSYNDSSAQGGKTIDDASVAVGAIEAKVKDNELYFLYKGADTVMKSDRIQLKNLDYVKAIDAADMVTPLKSVLVALDTNVNGGNPVSGQDYLLRIVFKQFYGMSDEDQYVKDCAVHATADMASTPKKFYDAMVDALNKAFSREVGATKDSNPYLKFVSTASGVEITEKPQEWHLGIAAQEQVMFDVVPTTIFVNGEDSIWGTVTDQTPAKSAAVVGTNAIGNGQKIADLEWFCMGERGDQYRMKGWPNYIPTTYMVDPTQEYFVLEIHHAFTDAGVHSYRSEKDITIVSTNKAVINAIVGAINSAANLSIATIA